MSICIPISSHGSSGNLVICDSQSSISAHKGIFNLKDSAYLLKTSTDDLLETIVELSKNATDSKDPGEISNLHIAVHWETLFCLLLWSKDIPSVKGAYLFLQEAGMSPKDLEPFIGAPLTDVFMSLYYSKRYDVLRRLCSKTKRRLEQRFPAFAGKTHCHLTTKEPELIAASSL